MFRSRFHSFVLLSLTTILSLTLPWAGGVQPVRAAGVIEVDSADDSVTADGACTLREAIINANNDDQSGSTDCAAGSGADVITFAGNYTITLGGQLPAVTSQITITGNGATNTIVQADAAPNVATYRVFEVNAAGNLTLDGLTVRHGRCNGACATNTTDGGGILNIGGTVTVTNSALSGNSADDGGGGIYSDNYSTVTVTNSALSNNSAGYGGGIYSNNYSTVTVTNSALSGNSATYSSGGGIFNYYQSTLTVTNSTLSGNSATYSNGGGIHNAYSGTLTVTNSTLSGNSANNFGGGIYNNLLATMNYSNTIIANSAAWWKMEVVRQPLAATPIWVHCKTTAVPPKRTRCWLAPPRLTRGMRLSAPPRLSTTLISAALRVRKAPHATSAPMSTSTLRRQS